MSNQEVIYSTPKFLQFSSESQNRLKPDGVQGSGIKDDKEFSVPWNLIAMTLGILCLLLSVAVTVLGTKVFQHIEEKHQLEEMLQNLTQKHNTVKNNNCLKGQPWMNKTSEYDIPRNEGIQQKKEHLTEKNICHRKKNLSKSLQYQDKPLEENWSCCGVSCYYFTTENYDWEECKNICQMNRLSLLKIEDWEELNFIQTQVYQDNYWIGLSYNKKESNWKWIDSSTFSGINCSVKTLPSGKRECAFLTSTRIETIDCSNTYNCICKKSILAFSASNDRRKN
ncbi:killer cell lectin-like receptor 2 [Erinaceus europaeus]|uniref:Killer cell lectin-like receptor 2 n=1 Tax=Erinaceus europaeus TaxID=9365 RepID=A0ABM3XKY7_ERIEU|nr:killer cell lectin-like receptor 2 [Erinaceus europaeus]